MFCRLPRLRLLRFDRPAIQDVSRAIDCLGLPGVDFPRSLAFSCPALECLQLVNLSLTHDLEACVANAMRTRAEWGFATVCLEVHSAVGSDADIASHLGGLGVDIVRSIT